MNALGVQKVLMGCGHFSLLAGESVLGSIHVTVEAVYMS